MATKKLSEALAALQAATSVSGQNARIVVAGQDESEKAQTITPAQLATAIPSATTDQAGVMTPTQVNALTKATTYTSTLQSHIIGELGNYDNSAAFDEALTNMTKDTHKNGRYFAKVGDVPLFVTFEILNITDNILCQWVEGAITVNSNGKISANVTTGTRIISRIYADNAWGEWKASALMSDVPTPQTTCEGTNKNYIYQDIKDNKKYVLTGVGKAFQNGGILKLRYKLWGCDNDGYDDGMSKTVDFPQVNSGADGAMNHSVYGRLMNHTIKVGRSTVSAVEINYTNFKDGGNNSFSIEAASGAKAGVMTSDMYNALNTLSNGTVVLMNQPNEGAALTALAESTIAGNTKIIAAHTTANNKISVTMFQSIANDYCRQIIFINDKVYQRGIYFRDSSRANVVNVEQLSLLFPDRLKWDTTSHKYVPSQFGNTFNADCTDPIPLASTTNDGLMSKEDKQLLEKIKTQLNL